MPPTLPYRAGLVCLIGFLLISQGALAMGPDQGVNTNPELNNAAQVWPYYNEDHFQWTNYNDTTHILIAYSATVVGALVLEHKLGMKTWHAALTMTLLVAAFGVAKEVFHDNYTSRTDIKTWMGGAAAGGLTIWTLNL